MADDADRERLRARVGRLQASLKPTRADDAEPEVAHLRARVRRLEAGAWLERLLLAVLFYFVWDEIPDLAKLVGAGLLGLLVVFATIERIRARSER